MSWVEKLERPLAFIDLETTGLNPCWDRIIEFAVCIIDNQGRQKDWSSLFYPERPIPPEATEIHGITDSDVIDSPRFAEWAHKIHAGLKGKDLAGYNIRRFDLVVLDEEFRRSGLRLDLEGVRVIDCAGIFFKKEPRKLADAVRRYCGRDHVDDHRGPGDAVAAKDVFLGQMGAYEDLRGMTLENLDTFSLMNERRGVDVAGRLYRDDAGVLCFAFGKYRDEPVEKHPDFAKWMLRDDLKEPFPGSTRELIQEELGRIKSMSNVGRKEAAR